jgi:hypothetical protein
MLRLKTGLTNRRIRRWRQARLVRGTSRAILNADQFNVRQPMKTLPRSNVWLACWWLVWGCLLAQQIILHPWHWDEAGLADNPSFSGATFFVILLPLAASFVLRWLVLPRVSTSILAFFVFLGGMVLAAMSGTGTTFLNVPFKQVTFLFCLAGIAEYLPIRARQTANVPNQSPDPTLSSGTPAAGQPPRLP